MNAPAKPRTAPRRLMTGPYLARNPAIVALMATADAVGFLSPRRSRSLPIDRPLSILVANQGHLGDLVNLLTVLSRLKTTRNVAKLGVVIGNWGRPVLDLGEFADRIHTVDHWSLNRSESGLLSKFRQYVRTRAKAVVEMRSEAYDVAIDTYPYFGNSAQLLWSIGAPVRIGFTSGGASSFYTHRISFDPKQSVAANQERLLMRLLEKSSLRPEVTSGASGIETEPDTLRLAESFSDYVVLHIGAGQRHKYWPTSAWIELGQKLIRDGLRLVYTGGPGEEEHCEPVQAALGGENLIGHLSLRGLATILSRARGLVSTDTVAGHLAAHFQVPTAIVQNGITPENLWFPNQPFARVVRSSAPCSPCNLTHGCESMSCIRTTSSETVYASLCEVMNLKAVMTSGAKFPEKSLRSSLSKPKNDDITGIRHWRECDCDDGERDERCLDRHTQKYARFRLLNPLPQLGRRDR